MHNLHKKKERIAPVGRCGGFTLIELITVIAIIGILAAATLVGLGPVQRSGRDTRRLSDMRQMQNILQIYSNRNNCYPTASGSCGGAPGSIPWGASPFVAGTLGYILTVGPLAAAPNMPVDPRSGWPYVYAHSGGANQYVIGALLEDPVNQALLYDFDSNNVFGTGVDCGTGVPPNETPPRYCVLL